MVVFGRGDERVTYLRCSDLQEVSPFQKILDDIAVASRGTRFEAVLSLEPERLLLIVSGWNG